MVYFSLARVMDHMASPRGQRRKSQKVHVNVKNPSEDLKKQLKKTAAQNIQNEKSHPLTKTGYFLTCVLVYTHWDPHQRCAAAALY